LRVDPTKRHHPVPPQLGASDNPFLEPRARHCVHPWLSTWARSVTQSLNDRPAHAFDWLLGAVPPALRALLVAKRIVIGDLQTVVCVRSPCQWLGLALAHGVPTAFVLPMIMAAAQGEVLVGPDDLSAQLQPVSGQIGGNDIAVQSPVPDISDIPREQRIGLPPVGAIVVEHLAAGELEAGPAPAEGLR
jgi:hypothetical protein